MSTRHPSYKDFAGEPSIQSPRQSSLYSFESDSDTTHLLFTQHPSSQSPTASRPPSDSARLSTVTSNLTVTLTLNPFVNLSFTKGSRLFKLRYSRIEVCKDSAGAIKCLELTDPSGLQGPFVHAFSNARLPVPHLEIPITSSQSPTLAVSFLEEQTVQTAQTLFAAQPHYTFVTWDDCVRFQEAMLGQTVIFAAGIAEAKSKGRGEECISQNIRVLRARSGKQSMIFFANSQRKEKKCYVSIPLDCVEQIDQNKKSGRPITLRLRPNYEVLAAMKQLNILFLDDTDQKRFYGILCQGVGYQAASS